MKNFLYKLCNKNFKRGDPFLSQKSFFKNDLKLTIFDVGACIGEISLKYKQVFPNSNIYCFEPFPESFEKLKLLSSDKLIKTFNFAFSDEIGKTTFNISSDVTCNSLFTRPKDNFKYYSENSKNIGQIEVETNTLTNFCEKENISKIEILKLDVEGAELKILIGAAKLLKENKIKIIYTEVMFIPHYQDGCLFHDIAGFLNKFNYSLFNLYNLKSAKNGQLRWGNAIFINQELRNILTADGIQ